MNLLRYLALSLCLLSCGNARAGQAVIDEVARTISSGELKGITGMKISWEGELLSEVYAPGYSPDRLHDIRSATKSITSLLLGVLVDEGKIKNLDKPLSHYLPDAFKALDEQDERRKISIEDALTMRTGLACNDWVPASVGHEDKMYRTDDWIGFLLEQPMAFERGKHFSYCTGGVVLLGRLIEAVAGEPVPDFANRVLFDPLGIDSARWEETPAGHTDTGGHLRLKLRDLHTLGQLVLNQGAWGEQRLLSKKWIRRSTQPQTRVPERSEQYGYLWWLNEGEVKGQELRLQYAHGNGGNFIFVVPELELIAAFTGKNYADHRQFIPLQVLSQQIIPALLD